MSSKPLRGYIPAYLISAIVHGVLGLLSLVLMFWLVIFAVALLSPRDHAHIPAPLPHASAGVRG